MSVQFTGSNIHNLNIINLRPTKSSFQEFKNNQSILQRLKSNCENQDSWEDNTISKPSGMSVHKNCDSWEDEVDNEINGEIDNNELSDVELSDNEDETKDKEENKIEDNKEDDDTEILNDEEEENQEENKIKNIPFECKQEFIEFFDTIKNSWIEEYLIKQQNNPNLLKEFLKKKNKYLDSVTTDKEKYPKYNSNISQNKNIRKSADDNKIESDDNLQKLISENINLEKYQLLSPTGNTVEIWWQMIKKYENQIKYLISTPYKTSKQPCIYYNQGYCKNGDECTYLHSDSNSIDNNELNNFKLDNDNQSSFKKEIAETKKKSKSENRDKSKDKNNKIINSKDKIESNKKEIKTDEVCVFFIKGNCKKDNCKFKHDKNIKTMNTPEITTSITSKSFVFKGEIKMNGTKEPTEIIKEIESKINMINKKQKPTKIKTNVNSNINTYDILSSKDTSPIIKDDKIEYKESRNNNCDDMLKDIISSTNDKKNLKTKMCIHIPNCVHGDNCKYAHTVEELNPRKCNFGSNCNKKDTCYYIHPNESKQDYHNKCVKLSK